MRQDSVKLALRILERRSARAGSWHFGCFPGIRRCSGRGPPILPFAEISPYGTGPMIRFPSKLPHRPQPARKPVDERLGLFRIH
jgi:hypothetical protein